MRKGQSAIHCFIHNSIIYYCTNIWFNLIFTWGNKSKIQQQDNILVNNIKLINKKNIYIQFTIVQM